MARHLQLTVRFLADRYHGSDWPSSPARLSLLVALRPCQEAAGRARSSAAAPPPPERSRFVLSLESSLGKGTPENRWQEALLPDPS